MPRNHQPADLIAQLATRAQTDVGAPLAWLESHLNDKALLSALEQARPDDAFVLALRGYRFLVAGNLLAAAADLASLQRQPDGLKLLPLLQGLFQAAVQKPQAALSCLVQAVNQHPRSLFVWQKLLQTSLVSGHVEQGLHWYASAIGRTCWTDTARFSLMEYGSALCDQAFAFDRAVAIRRETLALRLRMPPLPAVTAPAFVAAQAGQALADIVNQLEGQGLRPFPTAGTLLGWQRDGQILSHDKDIDLALLPPDDLTAARLLLASQPRYQPVPLALKSLTYLCLYDQQCRCTIDLLQFWSGDAGKLCYGWLLPGKHRPHSRIQHFDPFTLVRDNWQGRDYWRPDDPDHYLTQLYGDWRTPDAAFDSCAGIANLSRLTAVTQALAYNRLIACYCRGQGEKARAICAALQRHGDTHPVLVRLLAASPIAAASRSHRGGTAASGEFVHCV